MAFGQDIEQGSDRFRGGIVAIVDQFDGPIGHRDTPARHAVIARLEGSERSERIRDTEAEHMRCGCRKHRVFGEVLGGMRKPQAVPGAEYGHDAFNHSTVGRHLGEMHVIILAITDCHQA